MGLFDYETRDGRIDNDKLRSLCIKHDWFTCGTNSQYSKLFEMNEQGAGMPIRTKTTGRRFRRLTASVLWKSGRRKPMTAAPM